MNDDTLIAQLKEVGEHFCRLEAEARNRGYEVRFLAKWHEKAGNFLPSIIEVLKKV